MIILKYKIIFFSNMNRLTNVKYESTEIANLREQLANYQQQNLQLQKELCQSETERIELSKKLAEFEKTNKDEKNNFSQKKDKQKATKAVDKKSNTIVISMSPKEELNRLREQNKSLLKAYDKLRSEYQEMKCAKNIAEHDLSLIRYADCQTEGIISSLRIAKEKAEKLALEYKEAKEKAERQAAFEKKEKIRVKLQLENIQALIKKSLNKAESAQQQVKKAEAELNQQKKIKNRAMLNVSTMRIAKSKVENEVSTLKQQKQIAEEARIRAEEKVAEMQAYKEQIEALTNEQKAALELALSQVEEETRAREEAEQKALEECDEKILMEAELIIQMKENEMLLKQNQAHLESLRKAEEINSKRAKYQLDVPQMMIVKESKTTVTHHQ